MNSEMSFPEMGERMKSECTEVKPVVSPLFAPVGGRIMAPKDAYVLMPRTCEYVMLNGKQEPELQV